MYIIMSVYMYRMELRKVEQGIFVIVERKFNKGNSGKSSIKGKG